MEKFGYACRSQELRINTFLDHFSNRYPWLRFHGHLEKALSRITLLMGSSECKHILVETTNRWRDNSIIHSLAGRLYQTFMLSAQHLKSYLNYWQVHERGKSPYETLPRKIPAVTLHTCGANSQGCLKPSQALTASQTTTSGVWTHLLQC